MRTQSRKSLALQRIVLSLALTSIALFVTACSNDLTGAQTPIITSESGYPDLEGYNMIVPGVWQKVTHDGKSTHTSTFIDYGKYREALVWVMENEWKPFLESYEAEQAVSNQVSTSEYAALIRSFVSEGEERLALADWQPSALHVVCNRDNDANGSYRYADASAASNCPDYIYTSARGWSTGGEDEDFDNNYGGNGWTVTVSASATAPVGNDCRVRAESGNGTTDRRIIDTDYTPGYCY